MPRTFTTENNVIEELRDRGSPPENFEKLG
jgi:hypothetical protein